jgi:hypothetical protein
MKVYLVYEYFPAVGEEEVVSVHRARSGALGAMKESVDNVMEWELDSDPDALLRVRVSSSGTSTGLLSQNKDLTWKSVFETWYDVLEVQE